MHACSKNQIWGILRPPYTCMLIKSDLGGGYILWPYSTTLQKTVANDIPTWHDVVHRPDRVAPPTHAQSVSGEGVGAEEAGERDESPAPAIPLPK